MKISSESTEINLYITDDYWIIENKCRKYSNKERIQRRTILRITVGILKKYLNIKQCYYGVFYLTLKQSKIKTIETIVCQNGNFWPKHGLFLLRCYKIELWII